jgi:hypothetical protein
MCFQMFPVRSWPGGTRVQIRCTCTVIGDGAQGYPSTGMTDDDESHLDTGGSKCCPRARGFNVQLPKPSHVSTDVPRSEHRKRNRSPSALHFSGLNVPSPVTSIHCAGIMGKTDIVCWWGRLPQEFLVKFSVIRQEKQAGP